jgi:RNA polymerase sigma-70 factor (ECF subfamily)
MYFDEFEATSLAFGPLAYAVTRKTTVTNPTRYLGNLFISKSSSTFDRINPHIYKRSGRQIFLIKSIFLVSSLAYRKIDFASKIPYTIYIFMKNHKIGAEEIEALLEKFSWSIKASVSKFGLEKRGIDPEDVIQEVKIKIWKKFGQEKNISHYSSYIQRIINSILVDHIRKVRRQEKLILHEKQKLLFEERGNPGNPPQGGIFLELVGEAANSLMESRRKIVKLFLADLTIDEIASTLNWSRDKTRNLLYRGLSDLKEKLKDKGVEYENRY